MPIASSRPAVAGVVETAASPGQSVRQAGLDGLRVISFIGIVALHANVRGAFPAGPVGFIADEVSRFAVPAFFLLSGYLWKPELIARPGKLVARVAARVLPAFIFWLIVYWTAGAFGLIGWYGVEASHWSLARDLVTGGAGFHLWFLPALIFGTGVVALIAPLGWRGSIAVAFVLYCFGAAIGAYGPLLFHRHLDNWVFRNGLFFAPLFLLGGAWLRVKARQVLALPALWLAVSAFAFLLLNIAEGYFVAGNYPVGHDFSLATPGLAASIMAIAMRFQTRDRVLAALGELTFSAFLLHLLILETLLRFGLRGRPVETIVLTVVFSFATAATIRPVLVRVGLSRLML
ncbi:MAG: acyltransferase [Devosia sp.]